MRERQAFHLQTQATVNYSSFLTEPCSHDVILMPKAPEECKCHGQRLRRQDHMNVSPQPEEQLCLPLCHFLPAFLLSKEMHCCTSQMCFVFSHCLMQQFEQGAQNMMQPSDLLFDFITLSFPSRKCCHCAILRHFKNGPCEPKITQAVSCLRSAALQNISKHYQSSFLVFLK